MVETKELLRDVVGVGNAIVDVLAYGDDALLETLELTKGSMTLVDKERAQLIYSKMGDTTERSGGSVGNSVSALALLGASASYIGKVGNDKLGQVFRRDLENSGVSVKSIRSVEREGTGRCFVIVTAEGQRSMATHLGVCPDLKPEDIQIDLIQNHKITYLEGYLWDLPDAKSALVRAAEYARAAGRTVALSLSDAFCVQRHRASFLELIEQHVDILFGNEEEIVTLYEAVDFDDAVVYARRFNGIAALTRGEYGSLIIRGDETNMIDAAPVTRVIDTTGAGDLYASGVLFGMTRGYELQTCGKLGSMMASEVIGYLGGRLGADSLRRIDAFCGGISR